MKKHFLFAAAVVALMTCACSVETIEPIEPIQPEEDGEFTVLTAGFGTDGADTRTIRQEDGKVFWSANDEISVMKVGRSSTMRKFTSTNTAPAATAAFQGTLPSGTSFCAVHPYASSANYDGTYLVSELPNEQEAVAGTFADDLFISAAYFSSGVKNLSFFHVVGGIKFSVTEPGVETVTLTSNGGEPLAGVIGIQQVSGRPAVTAYGSTQSEIVLKPATGTFEVGETYYFVTLPGTLENGFTLVFKNQNGSIGVRTVNKSVTFEAAHFKKMMEVDKGVDYQRYFTYSASETSFPKAGGSFTVKVHASMAFHFQSADDWIWEVSREGDPVQDEATYTFKVAPNYGEERMGYLQLCNDSNCFIIPVMQEAGSEDEWKTAGFVHHSLGMRFTATWCGYCPIMSESFRLAKTKLGDGFHYACFYGSGGNYYFSEIDALANQYGVEGYPTGIVDGRVEIQNYPSETASNNIVKAVRETEATYPTATGLGIDSSVDGKTISVTVDVYTHLADSYKLTVLLLENNIIGYQADYTDGNHSDFAHNKVVRKALTSVSGKAFTVTDPVGIKSFSFTTAIEDEYDPDNLEILAYVQRPFGTQPVIQSSNYGDYYVDNCMSCAVGKYTLPDLK